MRESEERHASNLRISEVKIEVGRTLLRMVEQLPGLTHCEMAIALSETAAGELKFLHRAQLAEETDR